MKVMKKSAKALKDLTSIKQAIPPWVYTTTLLHDLPSPSYDAFVEIMLSSCGKDVVGNIIEPDFDEIVEKVLDRERRHKLKEPSNSKALKAAAQKDNKDKSNKSNSNSNKGNDRGRKKCITCGRSHGLNC